MDIEELVGRLQLLAAWRKPGGPTPKGKMPNTHRTALEAADALQSLTAENAKLRAERDELAGARVDGFNHGYLVAVSTMLHQHDEPVIAEDALRDSGLSLAVAKALDLDPFDMDVLRPIWAEIERKRKLPSRPQGASQ